MKKEKSKTNNKNQKKMKLLQKPLFAVIYCLVIVLFSLIAFVGIYKQDKNVMKNILPDYKLGTELYGAMDMVAKPEDNDQLSQEEKVENYVKSKDIILKRINKLGIKYYEFKFNEYDGIIRVEVPEGDEADEVAQFIITKGEYKISDNETDEVLLSNKDIKSAKAETYQSSDGTTVYFSIQFNNDAIEKLKEISRTYVDSSDEDENRTSKKIKMTIDDTTMMTSSFEEEIKNGMIQLTVGTSKDEAKIQEYKNKANRIAILLNTEALPVSYSIDTERLVYTSITKDTLNMIIIVSAIILVIMLIYMIFKFKLEGLFGALTNIGFLSLLLIVIRYTNVNLTLLGMLGIGLITVINYIMIFEVLKTNKKNIDDETLQLENKNVIIKNFEKIVPLAIIGIIFALTSWEPMISLGTVLFWGIIIMIIYSLITNKILYMNKKINKVEKKQEFHQM